MRELRHRVKNNLQIVSSLLNIQSNHLSDEEAINALKVAKNRILTISYLEDKIETDTNELNIKEFTETLCNSIIQTLSDEENMKFSINYSIENVIVKNFNTTLYGLILNEIITNTFKHAFPVYKKGNVLQIYLLESNNKIVLTNKDNGVGYNPEDISYASLGLDLVNDMVRQLNDTLEPVTIHSVENKIIIPTETNLYA